MYLDKRVFWVGRTGCVKQRISNHKDRFKFDFKYKTIKECDEETASDYEFYYMKKYKENGSPLLNIHNGEKRYIKKVVLSSLNKKQKNNCRKIIKDSQSEYFAK